MTISFNEIPNTRVPFCYVEFDNSAANQGPSVMPWRVLLIGQKLAAGTAATNIPVKVSSEAQGYGLFGKGSMLAAMVKVFRKNNPSVELWAVPMADVNAGVAATGTVTVSGPATAAGTLAVYIGGQVVQVAVENGDSASTIAAALKAAIDAGDYLPVTAAVLNAVVTVSARHKGACGNTIDMRANLNGEAFPAGVNVTIVAMADGATNPDISAAITAIGDERFNGIVTPYTDATNLTAIEEELATRWGPLTQNDGMHFTATALSDTDASTLGNTRNSPHSSILISYGSPSPVWEWAAAYGGVVSYHGAIDPARPLQTLPLKGILAPKIEDRLTHTQRDVLLHDGIATFIIASGGVVRLERAITSYKTNALGADDPSYLDIETLMTLSYLRHDFRTYFLTKYPRHKLADDGVRFGAGQAVLTPKIAKAEAIAKFRQWEEMGLVENVGQFKTDLVVERNATDPNRLDFLIPPDLINQARVFAAKIAFLL